MIVMKPEKKAIPGLKEKAKRLYTELGGITRKEVIAASIVGGCILALAVFAVMKAIHSRFCTAA